MGKECLVFVLLDDVIPELNTVFWNQAFFRTKVFFRCSKVLTNTNIFEIMSGPKSESVNRPSICLKQPENEEIFLMVGRRCTVS